ncbi:MAG: protein jag [Lachnospiraceae bacterium]|nr:protein jag [Lachnospiraceae bacterium]
MEFIEVKGKTVEEAITNAQLQLGITSDQMEYEIIERESNGFLGLIGKKDAVIKARKKSNLIDDTLEFLDKMFAAMNMEVKSTIDYNEESRTMNIDFSGEEMGILIGKRGQTLDSLQYLVSLVVNKESDSYIKVKVDTEDYRERRKATLENLAKNLSYKVKRTRRPVTLEPMNPYERRIIHSALQNDRYVETHSEGDEPYRKVVITLKKREKEYRKDYKHSRDNREKNA